MTDQAATIWQLLLWWILVANAASRGLRTNTLPLMCTCTVIWHILQDILIRLIWSKNQATKFIRESAIQRAGHSQVHLVIQIPWNYTKWVHVTLFEQPQIDRWAWYHQTNHHTVFMRAEKYSWSPWKFSPLRCFCQKLVGFVSEIMASRMVGSVCWGLIF